MELGREWDRFVLPYSISASSPADEVHARKKRLAGTAKRTKIETRRGCRGTSAFVRNIQRRERGLSRRKDCTCVPQRERGVALYPPHTLKRAPSQSEYEEPRRKWGNAGGTIRPTPHSVAVGPELGFRGGGGGRRGGSAQRKSGRRS